MDIDKHLDIVLEGGQYKVKKSKNGLYKGTILNGKRNGKGVYKWNEGKYEGDSYEGQFKNDKKCGEGIYYYKSGNTYKG